MQGMVTGMRGLCNGLGPAMFGIVFYLFHVDLNDEHMKPPHSHITSSIRNETVNTMEEYTALAPGPPFVFGAFMVALAIIVAIFIPNEQNDPTRRPSGEKKKKRNLSVPFFVYNFSFSFICSLFSLHFSSFVPMPLAFSFRYFSFTFISSFSYGFSSFPFHFIVSLSETETQHWYIDN